MKHLVLFSLTFFLTAAWAKSSHSVYPFVLQGYRPVSQGKTEKIEIVAEQVGSVKALDTDPLTESKVLITRPDYQLTVEGKKINFKKKQQAIFACPGKLDLAVGKKSHFVASCTKPSDTITMNLENGLLRISNADLEVLHQKKKYQGNALVIDPQRRVVHYFGKFKSKGKKDRNRQIASF